MLAVTTGPCFSDLVCNPRPTRACVYDTGRNARNRNQLLHLGYRLSHPSSSTVWTGRRRGPGGGASGGASGATMAAVEAPAALPSWETLQERLQGFKSNGTNGGVRLAHATERLFGSDTAPALLLYRDNSAWCPYCERVWLQLEEKQVSYAVEKINMRCYGPKPDWFMKMVPSGLLPVVKLDGKVVTESLDIMLLLENRFPDRNPLLPTKGTPENDALPGLLRLERVLMGNWLSCIKSFWDTSSDFSSSLDKVDAALRAFGGPYFLGSKFSLVDAVYAPFLERIAASVPYWAGITIRGSSRWPALNEWYDTMDSRSIYRAIKSDDFTITHTLEPQIGRVSSKPKGAAYREKIDGKGGHWDLPLKPEETAWGKDDGTGGGGAKEEAALALAGNHHAVVGFALRGVQDGERFRDDVDLAFRYAAYALLVGVDNAGKYPTGLPQQVAVAAAYFRDRVGVPRDLTYPAARQLRAHLQWVVRKLGSDL